MSILAHKADAVRINRGQAVSHGLSRTVLWITQKLVLAIFLILMASAQAGPDSNGVLYVNQNVAGGNGSGDSWDNALIELGDALLMAENLNVATPGTVKEIWIAQGIYKPTTVAGNGTSDRDKAFVLVDSVTLYGGFDGDETAIGERTLSPDATVLSGHLPGKLRLSVSQGRTGRAFHYNSGRGTLKEAHRP